MSIQFRHATLPNGMNVIAEIIPGAHTAAIGFFVKTGARDESPAVMGVSHFLEHMMFKGTATRTATDVDRQFDALGADHNAFTSSEMTAFYAHCLPEHLPRAEEILSDIMRPALRQDDFDAEKNVILEEIAMYQDNPFWVLYEKAMEEYYGEHPLSHRVLGTPETIQNLSRDQMLDYFENRYSADNTVVSLTGAIDFDAMVDRLSRHCAAWRATNPRRTHPALANGDASVNAFTMRLPSVNRHYMLMIAPAPAQTDDRRYAASMLAQIMGEPEGSRLYWSLVDPGLAEEAQAQYDGRDGLGETLLYASCTPKDAEEVQAVIHREIASLKDSLTQDDLDRVRAKVATGATLQGELPAGRMRRLGRVWMYWGEYRSLEDELARINAVTLRELKDVADAYPLTPRVVGHLTPDEPN